MTFNDAPSPLEPGYVATVDRAGRPDAHALRQRRHQRALSTSSAASRRPPTLARARAARDRLPAQALRQAAADRRSRPRPAATAIPPREAADLFERIARGSVPSAPLLHRFLRGQVWNTKLSAGLEPGDRFAHKTGDTDDTSHDGGILELAGGGRYVIVVYSELPSNDETDARFAAFMQRIRPLLVERERSERGRVERFC